MGERTQVFRSEHKGYGPADLNAEALSGFQSDLLEAGVSPALAHAYHRVIKNFARFCIDHGYLTEESVLRVKAPHLPSKEPETYSSADEANLLKAAHTARDRFLIEFMLHTGLRLQEVVNVRLDDVVDGGDGAFVRVRQGKGRKDRIVPLDTPSHPLSRSLRTYVAKVRPESASPQLFLSARRNSRGDHEPLTARGIQLIFRRLAEQTEIHVHPHKFRHTFATRALAAGVDVMALQRVLGHTTLAMVSRYVHYQTDDLLNAWAKRRD